MALYRRHHHTHAPWDYDEYSNYQTFSCRYPDDTEGIVHVYNNIHSSSVEDVEKRKNVLFFLDRFTRDAQKYCNSRGKRIPPTWQLFTRTNHTFFELPLHRDFKGVNKPKNVHDCALATDAIGPDGTLRAHERYVMMTLPSKVSELESLYGHEIAHTFCNHVRFREDDHHGDNPWDFPACEKQFKSIMHALDFRNRLVNET